MRDAIAQVHLRVELVAGVIQASGDIAEVVLDVHHVHAALWPGMAPGVR
nr:hypothetical protein [Pseudomonas asiatica]